MSDQKLSLAEIRIMAKSLNQKERQAALLALCDYPESELDGMLDVIRRCFEDEFLPIPDRAIGLSELCFGKYRAFEPPAQVYKECQKFVIVVASIPEDAEIRAGYRRGEGRANKAKILEVIGAEYGTSICDPSVQYHKGDLVEIANFDYSNRKCSTGFHFYTSRDPMRFLF